jgi:hypothetical protein
MKKMILIAATIALAASTVIAQTTITTGTNGVVTTNTLPTIPGALGELVSALENSGLDTATNYALEPYLTYAPKAPSGNQVGGGLFLCYNVSSYIGTGLGVDYLGQFSLVSANVELKVPTHPFRNLTIFNGALTNIAVCPFAIGGLGVSLSGGGGGAIAVTDAGAYVGFGHLWGGQFNAGAAYGRWDNAGAYSGPRYHFFAGWSKGF